MDSILTSIKKMLGITEEDTNFDQDIIININSVLMILNQLGIGENGFTIQDSTAKWVDFIGDRTDLSAIQTYIYLKVKLLFDTPTNSFVIDSINRHIGELEWRLNIQVEGGN